MSAGWDEVFPEPLPARHRVVTRRRVVVAALVTAVTLVIGSVVWLLTYDPLELGSVGGGAWGTLAWSSADTGVGDTVYYVSVGKPGAFEIGYDVANTGRLAVTIRGLSSPSAFTLAGMARYPTFESPNNHAIGEIVPFEPVKIDPGESRYLVLELEITGESVCTTRGGSGVPSDPSLRYRTLGIVPGETTVALPFTVVTVCGDELPPSYDGLFTRSR